MTLHTYLAQDRLRALVRGETVPDRTSGSALFADIAGFTPLTEALRTTLGARRGAEALSHHLDAVYAALIQDVERYGGSVIGFAGDAITCWFDEQRFEFSVLSSQMETQETQNSTVKTQNTAAGCAVACAFALQAAMRAFGAILLPNGSTTPLTLKVAVATGPARRFVVGDPQVQYLDTLVGATVTRTATAEHLATRSDILLDETTVLALGSSVIISEWRTDAATNERFAVVTGLTDPIEIDHANEPVTRTAPETLKAWVPQTVYERERDGQGTFLTEFRPTVALFLRFVGLDYEGNDAQAQLDAFLQRVQAILARYEGTVIQLTIGDKGSYAYLTFGAVNAHEDDARRAVKAARELRTMAAALSFLEPLQIGITQGTMRVGAYGGPTRKTFGALGDDVNLAARLMTSAAPGELLVSGNIHKTVEAYFVFEPRSPLPMKGKAEPLPVFAVMGERKHRAIRLQEPSYALPMVGRTAELQTINDKLDMAARAQAQVIGVVAEAGMGKSRLVAEVIRLAHKKGFIGYGGACQSDGVHTPYLAWKAIWQAFFDVDPAAPLRKQVRHLEGELEDRAPERLQALPLLNIVLELDIPDNDFTGNLEPQYRKSTLTALLEDCLRAASQEEPLLIVIEDLHWIDALSHDLLEALAKALADCPICFVLAYRPPQLTRLQAPRLEALPQFTKIVLHELTQAEAEGAIRAKLAQLYPARTGAVPSALVEKLMARAQGNPFYLEELLNYLRDRGLDPRDPADLNKIELPDSLHTLILSRIDRLSEREKTTLRVASIVGRLFRAAWLTGYYPALGDVTHVMVDLDQLDKLDITPLDSEPELAYLFKHIVTHEVTYESLPFALRATLHEQLARYLEQAGAPVDTIAHHYGRSDNTAKKREYYQKAADAALGVSAFVTAVEYLTRLLELTPGDDPGRSALALQLAEAHYRLSDIPAARAAIEQAQAAAQTDADRASALALLGEMMSEWGSYAEGEMLLAQAVPLARASGDPVRLCHALYALGDIHWRLGNLDDAHAALAESLALAQGMGNETRALFALNRLGMVAVGQGDLAEAERLLNNVHARAVAVGNRERELVALNNLGVVANLKAEFAAEHEYQKQALALARAIGAQQDIALHLLNLGEDEIEIGDLSAGTAHLREGLALARRIGMVPWMLQAVLTFAYFAHATGQTERALALVGMARRHPAWSPVVFSASIRDSMLAEWAPDPAVLEAGLAKGAQMDWDTTLEELLQG